MHRLSDYCTITRTGDTFIDIDSGWKFRCVLNGMRGDYAQLFIRRLSKKRRLDDFDDLLAAEVVVPDMMQQEIIVKTVKTVDDMWFLSGELMEKFRELKQITGDSFYDDVASGQVRKLGLLNDYRFMLIDQLMGI